MNLRIVGTLARKDLADALRNWNVLIILLFPIGFSILFGMFFREGDDVLSLRVAVFDQGNSALPGRLQERSTPGLDFSVDRYAERQMLYSAAHEKAVAGLIIPPGFDQAMRDGRSPSLTLYLNQGKGERDRVIFKQVLNDELMMLARKEPPAHIDEQLVNIPVKQSVEEALSLRQYMLSLWLIMALAMVGVMTIPYLMVEEKEKGTLRALLVSPASYSDVALGKLVAGLFYTIVSALVILAANGGPGGNPALTVVVVVLTSLFLVQVGLLVGGVARNMTQVGTWATAAFMPLMLPAITTGMGDGVLQSVMKVIPTWYALDAIHMSMAARITGSSLAIDLAVLTLCPAIAFVAVVWTLQRQRR